MKTYEDTLVELAGQYPELLVMTAENRGSIRGIPSRLGDRFIDVGICEQTMIGMAAGLALRGRVPVTHALATFLTLRAFEFIRTDVGISGLPVIMVGAVPGFLSEANGPTHQAIEDLALMRGIPGMQVVCPADGEELVAALPALVASRKPAYVRYYAGEPVVAHQPYEIGRAEVHGDGDDVSILVCGFLLGEALAAQKQLAALGIGARVVSMRSLKPLDREAVLAAAKSKLVVTVEDHFLTGGLFTAVAETLALAGVAARLHPIALAEKWFKPAMLPAVLAHEGFTGAALARRIGAALEGSAS
jgi:transketolase